MMKNILRYLLFFYCGLIITAAISCNNKNADHAGHNDQEQAVYTCPMHPEIIRNAPGSCPICGMDLVLKEVNGEGVKDLEMDALLKPANAFVISTIPVTAPEQREEDIDFSVVGTVAYDSRQAGVVSSRISGRIEKLYVRYKYQRVKKGQRIMDIYSPELMTAQQNLLFLLKNDPANASLISAAKERLILLGMSSTQVAGLVKSRTPQYSVPVFSNFSGFITEWVPSNQSVSSSGMQVASAGGQQFNVKEGMYLQAGQAVFTVYNADRAWILLDIYPEFQTLVATGNAVRIVPETAPHQNFRATISYMEPVFRTGAKTLSARVYFNNSTLQLPIGSRVTANIFIEPKNAWWLPKEAVLSLGRDKIVFQKEETGFRAHKITTGPEVNHFIQVISGLDKEDSVAVNAQFLVDNEAFIKITKQ